MLGSDAIIMSVASNGVGTVHVVDLTERDESRVYKAKQLLVMHLWD